MYSGIIFGGGAGLLTATDLEASPPEGALIEGSGTSAACFGAPPKRATEEDTPGLPQTEASLEWDEVLGRWEEEALFRFGAGVNFLLR